MEKLDINEPTVLLSPPQKRGLANQVTDSLRQSILRGHFVPGQHLLEEELAEKLNVSRGPVREALVQLEHEGLVIVRRNRGAFVARLSPNDAEEVYSLRLALERLAAQSFIQKATHEDLAALQQVIDAMKEAHGRGMSPLEAADLDIRFHDLLYSASHHERLTGFWSNLRSQVYILLLSATANNSDYNAELADSHTLVLDALRTRNPNLATRIVEDHLSRSFELVRKSYVRNTEIETTPPLISGQEPQSLVAESRSRP